MSRSALKALSVNPLCRFESCLRRPPMKHLIALLAALASIIYVIYITCKTINADGTWYNELYMDKGSDNVTFVDKLKATLFEDKRSLDYSRIGAALVFGPIAVYVLVRIIIAGVINF